MTQLNLKPLYFLLLFSCLILTTTCGDDETDNNEMMMDDPTEEIDTTDMTEEMDTTDTEEPQDTTMDPEPIPCEGSMFGIPIEATGLDNSICNTSCECIDFVSKDFTPEQLASLREWELIEPYEELTENPYESPLPYREPGVCAMVIEDLANKLYSLQQFSDAAAAEEAGAILTHHDACGLCSTLSDFATYAEDRDIGAAVRACALANLATPFDSLVSCIASLGFTLPCAQIWAYNTLNTRNHCFEVCITSNEYHNPDGTLSECLQCDEDISGPIFKAFAGRTRRNTGLASSICRFCDEVQAVEHDYPF